MSSRLVTNRVWETITAACQKRQQKAWVAVAFFGKAGPSLLPLPKGSHLVANVSENAVRQGLTHPDSLRKMIKTGVHVYDCSNLHSKVFVFGQTAIVGSANASQRSKHALSEAVLVTTDRNAVVDAREYVRSKAIVEVGPEQLIKLQKLYRPPQSHGPRSSRSATNEGEPPTLRIVQLVDEDPPVASKATADHGRKTAKEKAIHGTSHHVVEFHWHGRSPFRDGDEVIQVTTKEDGRVLVSPPGRVLHTEIYQEGRTRWTFVYLEKPRRQPKQLDRVAQLAGRGSKKILRTDGVVKEKRFQRILREIWRK